MKSFTKPVGALLGVAILAAASPAAAQYERSRSGRVADEIARGVRDAAEAVGTVTEALYESVNGIRYRGHERFVIDRCAPRVEQYGRMRIQDVHRYGRRSWRVYGTVDNAGYYPESYSSRGSGYGYRAFTCTVRNDGRVKVKMRRIRY